MRSIGGILADQPAGRWVVLDSQMTHVLGAAETPEEALRKAGVTKATDALEERPVVIQVPDPHMICLY